MRSLRAIAAWLGALALCSIALDIAIAPMTANAELRGVASGNTSSVSWPATNSIVLSNSTSSPAGLAPINGDCVVGAGGVWTAGSCSAAALTVNIMSVTTVAVTPASATPVSSGLSATVVSGGTYSFEIHYYVAASSTANSTISLNLGTATVTSIVGSMYSIANIVSGQLTITQITALSTTNTNSLTTAAFIEHVAIGTFVVNAGGTFIPGYATAATSTTSLSIGSWMRLIRIN